MNLFKNRDDLIRHYLKPNMIGAELGVFAGEFSDVILSTNPSTLFLIDLFDGIQGSGDRDGNNMVYIDMNSSMNALIQKYSSNSSVKIVKNSSSNFLMSIENDSLDFVYIDADHSYEGVKQDTQLSLSKVKNGGYIIGHDYVSPRFDGVVKAVNEFCEKSNLSIDGLSRCGCPTFCIPVRK